MIDENLFSGARDIGSEDETLLERFDRRRKFLTEVSEKLKQDFVGLDDIIDSFIDKIEAWYIMPESMRRPAIICLWGMTGIGKTDLVRKLIRYLNFGDRFLEVQMTNKGAASSSSFDKGSIQSKIEMSNLEPNTPGVIFLDEMHRYRTKDEKGSAIKDMKDQDIWQLLSDGRFAASTRRKQLYELLYGGLLYDWDALRFGASTADDEDAAREAERKKNAKYKRGYYTAKKIKRLLKLDNDAIEIMEWSDEEKETVVREAIKNDDLFEGDDYSKLLIIISGNIDEAYKMSKNVSDGDVDADVLHEFSKNINFLDIKGALLQRFYPEQIARFGNNHIVYPSLSKASYEEVINHTLRKISYDVVERHSISIEFSDRVREFIYRNGVFPTQGVRPVFSTIYASVENLVPKVIMTSIENDCNNVVVDYSHGEKAFRVYRETYPSSFAEEEERLLLRSPYTGDIDRIKDDTPLDTKMLYAVHEIGHAIIYAHEFGYAPTQIEPNAATDGAFVGMHSITLNKKTILSKVNVSIAGYAAENLVFRGVTSGSSQDISDATAFLKRMIKDYGMEKYLVSVGNPHMVNGEQNKAYSVQDGFDEISVIDRYMKKALGEVSGLLSDRYRYLLIELSKRLFDDQKMELETFAEICAKHNLKVKILPPEYDIIPNYVNAFEEFVKYSE